MKRLIIACLALLIGSHAVADEKNDILDAAAKTFDQVDAVYQDSGMNGLQQEVQDCYRKEKKKKSSSFCMVVDGMSFWIDQAVTGQLKMPATPYFQRKNVVDRIVKSGNAKNKKESEKLLDSIMNMTTQAYDRTETHKNAQADDGQPEQ